MVILQIEQPEDLCEAEEERLCREMIRGFACIGEFRDGLLL